jgi:hypothetical protein
MDDAALHNLAAGPKQLRQFMLSNLWMMVGRLHGQEPAMSCTWHTFDKHGQPSTLEHNHSSWAACMSRGDLP